jgi:hypothetical protein
LVLLYAHAVLGAACRAVDPFLLAHVIHPPEI